MMEIMLGGAAALLMTSVAVLTLAAAYNLIKDA